MQPCTFSDIEALYSECGDDDSGQKMRNVEYRWIEPKICNDKDPKSVALLQSGKIKCRKCGRGEYSEAGTEICKYCPDGTYQDQDRHQDANQVSKCTACPKGTAAAKALEFEDFEVVPPQFTKQCSAVSALGADPDIAQKTESCDHLYGWRPSQEKTKLVSVRAFMW
jgi:hypothetical protein